MASPYLNTDIAREKLVKTLISKGIKNQKVLDAFRNVERHKFVDGTMFNQAYEDNALPIGLGQTISQPFVVAYMTELLEIEDNQKILEIGTGSGFQSAILAQFSNRVYSIERHRELGERARLKLRELGYQNIIFKIGDGTKGWHQHAPFDRIIVTAGAPSLPRDLINQLAPGGKLLIPSGTKSEQKLEIYDRRDTVIEKRIVGDVLFVPLVGKKGWKE